MSKTTRRRRRRRRWPYVVVALVVLAAGAAGAQYRYGALRNAGIGLGLLREPATGHGGVALPVGLRLPAQPLARQVALADGDGDASAARVDAALRPYLHPGPLSQVLGPDVRVLVTTMSGRVLFAHGSGPITPASTTKLLTTTAALDRVGPMTTFATTVRQVPNSGKIVLVGGGDPFLAKTSKGAGRVYPARASLSDLASQTAAALRKSGHTRVRLAYDDSLFSGPAVDPKWPASYQPTVVPPISALWVNEDQGGAGFLPDPSLSAAQVFASKLRADGIHVRGAPEHQRAPAGAAEIAQVRSAPLGEIVQQTLAVSDNNAAEVIARHVGIATGNGGSFVGADKGIRETLVRLGVPVTGLQMYDGSGLSRNDRIDPRTLLAALRIDASAAHPQLREVITGLPVAGFTGSLIGRYQQAPAAGRGRVRAKTGTLTGVSALVGVATDLDGDQMMFAVMADQVSPLQTLDARALLDGITAALGACHCQAQAGTTP